MKQNIDLNNGDGAAVCRCKPSNLAGLFCPSLPLLERGRYAERQAEARNSYVTS